MLNAYTESEKLEIETWIDKLIAENAKKYSNTNSPIRHMYFIAGMRTGMKILMDNHRRETIARRKVNGKGRRL